VLPTGQDVRINWPDHPTNGWYGYVARHQSPSGYNLVMLHDGSLRAYPDNYLTRVRRVVTYVEEPPTEPKEG
jgi:hypothetical protein